MYRKLVEIYLTTDCENIELAIKHNYIDTDIIADYYIKVIRAQLIKDGIKVLR